MYINQEYCAASFASFRLELDREFLISLELNLKPNSEVTLKRSCAQNFEAVLVIS